MNPRWVARVLVMALHAALLTALWLHGPRGLEGSRERLSTTVTLIVPTVKVSPPAIGGRLEPPAHRAANAPIETLRRSAEAPAAEESSGAAMYPAPPTEPPRTALRLTLPPGYAASAAAARNPALSDARSNTARPTLEDRIADATGGAGAWVEQHTSDNLTQSVGALGERRAVLRRGNVCVEVFRSHIADTDGFNANVAPRTVGMVGKPYTCR